MLLLRTFPELINLKLAVLLIPILSPLCGGRERGTDGGRKGG